MCSCRRKHTAQSTQLARFLWFHPTHSAFFFASLLRVGFVQHNCCCAVGYRWATQALYTRSIVRIPLCGHGYTATSPPGMIINNGHTRRLCAYLGVRCLATKKTQYVGVLPVKAAAICPHQRSGDPPRVNLGLFSRKTCIIHNSSSPVGHEGMCKSENQNSHIINGRSTARDGLNHPNTTAGWRRQLPSHIDDSKHA